MLSDMQILSFGIGGIGVGFIVAWLILFLIWKKQMKYNTPVYAEVISIERRSSSQTTGYTYYPHYSLTYNGKMYELVHFVGTSKCNCDIGDVVKLYIDEKNPKHFRVDGTDFLKILWIAFLCVGLILALIGLIIFAFAWRYSV